MLTATLHTSRDVCSRVRTAGFHALRLSAALLTQAARLPSAAEEVVASLLQLSGPVEQIEGIEQLYTEAEVRPSSRSDHSRARVAT